MARCYHCGCEVSFIKREGKKPLIINPAPVYFVPDSNGEDNFIHNGVWRRGTRSQDGLKGHIIHNCRI